jgi:hypothetical protein
MALTASQIAERLLKKAQGVADTKFPLTIRGIKEEPTSTYAAVTPDNIWLEADQIPTVPPTISTIGGSGSQGVLKYYDKLLLVQHDGGSVNSFRAPGGELEDAVSSRFGFDYNFKVWNTAGTQEVFKGDWLVDAESGIITFYSMSETTLESPPVTINNTNPPRITFYKYIGEKGAGKGTIQGLTAGKGLSGGGTAGYITLDVNLGVNSGLTFSGDNIIIDNNFVGNGLTFSTGVLSVDTNGITSTLAGNGLTANGSTLNLTWGGTSSGLTVSNDAIGVVVDGSTIQINSSGQLTVIAGASQPVYDVFNSSVTSGDHSLITGVTLSYLPNSYSRIQVYVNGQLQRLGDNDATKDCYFGTASNSPIALSSLLVGDQLYWNGLVSGFDLSATDKIDIIYES